MSASVTDSPLMGVAPLPLPVPRSRWLVVPRLGANFVRLNRESVAGLILPVVAYAITTAMIVIVAGGTAMFWRIPGNYSFLYQLLSLLALVLLIVPLTSLGGAAARLSTRRRDDRLASLRLLGVTGSEVTLMTVVDATIVALIGAALGVALSIPLACLTGLLNFHGSAVGSAALWPGWQVVLGIVLLVGAIGAGSAASGLRRVIVSPLGVRTRVRTPQPGWVRPVLASGLLGLAALLMNVATAFGSFYGLLAALACGVGVGLMLLNLVGPWIISRWAIRSARRARGAVGLLAGRGVQADPGTAWRQVSGVALSSFIAVAGGLGVGVAGAIGDRGNNREDLLLSADITLGVYVVLGATYLIVAATVAITQIAQVLDRRELWVALSRTGVPRRTLNSMRALEAIGPVLFVSVLGAIAACVVFFPITGLALLLNPVTLLYLAGTIALGVALIALATVIARPVLSGVLRHPERV